MVTLFPGTQVLEMFSYPSTLDNYNPFEKKLSLSIPQQWKSSFFLLRIILYTLEKGMVEFFSQK